MIHASIFFLIALIVPFTTSNPLSQRGLGIHVSGRLCCSVNGNCLGPGQGVSGVVVSLACNSGVYSTSYVAVGQNVTDVNGLFQITEQYVPAVNLDQEQPTCAILVRFPLIDLNCLDLSGTIRSGALVGPIRFYGVTRAPFGYVKEGKVTGFIRTPTFC